MLILALCIIGLVFVVGLLLLTRGETAQAKGLGADFLKAGVQGLVAAAAGGLLVQEYSRYRLRQSAANEFRRRVLHDLITAYGKTKKARRMLRANSSISPGAPQDLELRQLSYNDYSAAIILLGDAQLELEVLIHQMNTFEDVFESRNEIRKHVTKMHRYLDRVTDEYERSAASRAGQTSTALSKLPMLSSMLSSARKNDFRERFTGSFQTALSLIQMERVPLS